MRYVARIVLLSGALLLFASSLYAIAWRDDIESVMKEAAESQTPVMADFYTDWCGWCKKLDSDTFSDPRIEDLSRQFICVKVNAEKAPGAATRYGVRGYPTVIFFDCDGNVKNRIGGYEGPDRFASVMSSVLQASEGSSTEHLAAAVNPKRPSFKLGGIVLTPKGPKAIINNNIVKVGDAVGGAKVIKIAKESVELSVDGVELVLNLE
ncbi:MAG: thioredoxin family protein [Candidatus Omnitrophota bacterium]|jgi:thioredoxin-related protein